MYQYPYGNAQQLNLDWILSKLQELESGSGGGADLEEVANALVSASFDATNPYRKYDYAFYDGKLYRALNDTIGAFNPSDWMEVTLGADIPVLTRLLNAVDASLTTLQGQVADLDSDDVDNASNVTGTTVTDALDNLNGAISDIQSAITGLDSAFKEFHFRYDSVTINAKSALNVFPNNIGDLPSNYVIIGIRGIWTGATQTVVRGYVAATGEVNLTNTADTSQTASPNMLVLCIDKSVLASFF